MSLALYTVTFKAAPTSWDVWFWIYYHFVLVILDLPKVKQCGCGGGDKMDAVTVIDLTKIPIYHAWLYGTDEVRAAAARREHACPTFQSTYK